MVDNIALLTRRGEEEGAGRGGRGRVEGACKEDDTKREKEKEMLCTNSVKNSFRRCAASLLRTDSREDKFRIWDSVTQKPHFYSDLKKKHFENCSKDHRS